MARSAMTASETDVNSPTNQTLMDKVRGNDDDHETRILALEAMLRFKNVSGSGSDATAGAKEFVLDSSIDWRDRNIRFSGVVGAVDASGGTPGTLAEVQKLLPGGAYDDNTWFAGFNAFNGGALNFTASAEEYDWIDGWMYSTTGSAAYTTEPTLKFAGQLGTAGTVLTDFYIWVDNTNSGALTLTIAGAGSNNTFAAWNLMVMYTADLGGH